MESFAGLGNKALSQVVTAPASMISDRDYTSAKNEAAVTPHIVRGAQELVEARESLSSLIAELEKRISPILHPHVGGAAGQGVKDAPSPNRSPVAQGLFDTADYLRLLSARVGSIIDRLEL